MMRELSHRQDRKKQSFAYVMTNRLDIPELFLFSSNSITKLFIIVSVGKVQRINRFTKSISSTHVHIEISTSQVD